MPWEEVPGWQADHHASAWPALLNNCRALQRESPWQDICAAANSEADPDDERARQFFETWFEARELVGENGSREGLITGYYEPLLQGSLEAAAAYPYPLYGRPDSLLAIDLTEVEPTLKSNKLRGMVDGRFVRPFYQRAAIDDGQRPLAGDEVLWVDDAADAFFLHVQGSGRVQLEDGRILALGFADHNGHPYVSIGKVLVERGELPLEDVSLFTIREWLAQHPAQAQALYNENPRYIFFALKGEVSESATGSLNVPLTPARSLAIDPEVVPLGTPVWLSSRDPGVGGGDGGGELKQLMFAQDTGAAIKGALRADVFWGHGDGAEYRAGTMKEAGSMLVLLPRTR